MAGDAVDLAVGVGIRNHLSLCRMAVLAVLTNCGTCYSGSPVVAGNLMRVVAGNAAHALFIVLRHEELSAFGSAARIAEKSIESAREQGIKVGLFRPITLWPFPEKEIHVLAKTKKGILVVEINAGQMVQDVRLAVNGQTPVEHFGRLGGIVPEPEEIVEALKKLIK